MDKFTITSERQIEPLNLPQNWDEINLSPIQKFASKEKTFDDHIKNIDLGGFDIVSAVKENPDHLFVKVFAIKKDEVNDNGDYFSENELKKSAKTMTLKRLEVKLFMHGGMILVVEYILLIWLTKLRIQDLLEA
jgi:AICAR transformylase/IMP cyclohydrolase PurH